MELRTQQARDEAWMQIALLAAERAADAGEVPVGAVLVGPDGLVVSASNERESTASPLAHAEVLAVERAAAALGHWRMDDCTLYVTLEPCPMCAGALAQSRLGRLVYGAAEPRSGAVRSMYQLCDDPRSPHRMEVVSGVLEPACAQVLRTFFAARRLPSAERTPRR